MNKRKLTIVGIIGAILIAGAGVGGLILYFPTLNLPSQPVTMMVYDGSVSYFSIHLSDVPPGYDVADGFYVGWCADRSVTMPRGEYLTVRLYNTYDLLLPLPLRDKDWDKVNWILNNRDGATKEDIQEAFWVLLNDYPYESVSPMAKSLVDNAVEGFMPQPGELIAVLAEPVETQGRCWPFQFAFLQVTLHCHEGCTPGYWKNHEDCWIGYEPDDKIVDVFTLSSYWEGVFGDDTLLQALSYSSGNSTAEVGMKLMSHAVAGLLNSANSNINYPMLEGDIISAVYNALETYDPDTIEDLKDQFDYYNNAGCPIDAHCEPCTECD